MKVFVVHTKNVPIAVFSTYKKAVDFRDVQMNPQVFFIREFNVDVL